MLKASQRHASQLVFEAFRVTGVTLLFLLHITLDIEAGHLNLAVGADCD